MVANQTAFDLKVGVVTVVHEHRSCRIMSHEDKFHENQLFFEGKFRGRKDLKK